MTENLFSFLAHYFVLVRENRKLSFGRNFYYVRAATINRILDGGTELLVNKCSAYVASTNPNMFIIKSRKGLAELVYDRNLLPFGLLLHWRGKKKAKYLYTNELVNL